MDKVIMMEINISIFDVAKKDSIRNDYIKGSQKVLL